jgi:hypothetical protein
MARLGYLDYSTVEQMFDMPILNLGRSIEFEEAMAAGSRHLRRKTMITIAVLGFVFLSISALQAAAQDAPVLDVVNVTSDSEPGWVPNKEQREAAEKLARNFFAAKDSNQGEKAFLMLMPSTRETLSLSTYSAQVLKFNADAGPIVERLFTTTTWTKDSARGPVPGVYAAIDIVSRFAEVARHCGYLILYQPPEGGEFQIMRHEEVFMPNKVAKAIEKENSAEEVERAWKRAASSCPNYPPRSLAPILKAGPPPLPEAEQNTIGYPTVAAALADLKAKAGVRIYTQDGWTVAEDIASSTFWSFPPEGHPAYPSAVKRQVTTQEGNTNLSMSVRCEADKKPCDDLVRAFQALNQRMTEEIRRKN